MKYRLLFTTLLSLLTTTFAFSQSRPSVDFVKYEQLYLVSNGRYIKFDELKNSTIKKLLGKPLKVKNEKWEVNDAKNNRTYVYKNGELVLEDGLLSFIDINKNGWYLSFKKGQKFTKPVTVGNNIFDLKRLFPISFENRTGKAVYVQIAGCDCSISFTYSGNIITKLGFYTNES